MKTALVCSLFTLLSAGSTFGQLLAYHAFPPDSAFRTTVAVLHPGPDALLVLGQTANPFTSAATGEVMVRKWNQKSNLWSSSQAAPYVGGLLRVADLDGDGHEDILIADERFRLYSGATSLFLGESLAGGGPVHWLGDLDGDGFDEFTNAYGGAPEIWTTANLQAPPISLNAYAFGIPFGQSYGLYTDAAAISDMNGDGIRDVIVGYGDCDMAAHGGCVSSIIHNRAIVYSGLDGTPLILAEGPGGHTHLSTIGKSIVELDDLDGDGRPEVLIATGSWLTYHFYIYSGASSVAGVEPLMLDADMSFEPTTPHSVVATWAPLLIGDVNADGFKDLALPYSRRYPSLAQTPDEYQSGARFLDGRTLDRLWDLPLPAALPVHPYVHPGGEYLAMGDVNSDSFPDFTTFHFAYGSVWVYSGAPIGTRSFGGGRSGTLGPTPRISVQRPPRVGETSLRFNSTEVSPGATAVLLLSRDYQLSPVVPGVDILYPRHHIATSTATVAGRVQATTTVDFTNAFQAGDRLFAQWVFLEPTPTGQHFAASPILAVSVQD